MSDPIHPRGFLGGALRWLVSASVASVVTAALFALMIGLVDGSWILDQLIRVFPLHQTELDPEERCRLGPPHEGEAILLEGIVGTSAVGRFVPLGDAELRSEDGGEARRLIEVSPDGHFRAVVSLPGDLPKECREKGAVPSTPQLLVRAPGCEERRVPVTRAWVSRRILLSCAARTF